MDVFYINIAEFKNSHDKDFLIPYSDKSFKSEKRFYEYGLGRYLVKSVAKEVYGIDDAEIIVENTGKPIFKNSDIQFCISHSNNIVMASFDKNPCGLDIEFIKTRNIEKLSEHFGQKFANSDDFYKFWTLKEASYKLNSEVKAKYCAKFENYYLTIVSNNDLNFSISEFLHNDIIKLSCNKLCK
ncbi:hypothetical protein IJ541_09565 [bacterium]|nr:hypothetical protein [bacterium]